MRTYVLGLGIAAALTAAAPATAATNLINNPGFEAGLANFFVRPNGATTTMGGGFQFSGALAAALGNAPAPGDFGGLSQAFTTVAGETYDISFQLSSDGGTPNNLRVNFVDKMTGTRQLLLNLVDAPAFDYTPYSFQATALGTTSTIAFTFDNATGSFFGLDDLSVSVIPEPATWALMIAGFGMVGVAARRRRPAVISA